MEIDCREIARLLGYKGTTPGEDIQALMKSCLEEITSVARPSSTWQDYPLELDPQEELMDLGCFSVHSHSLYRNLQGCTHVILFAATLGPSVDVLIHRYSFMEITRSVVMQSAAAAMIESYCDEVQKHIGEEMLQKGLYMRPRFSPGYGDLPLETQRDLIRVLATPKKIGLTLTEDCLMAPMKSVTAFIGLSPHDSACHKNGCEACNKRDCQFRRN